MHLCEEKSTQTEVEVAPAPIAQVEDSDSFSFELRETLSANNSKSDKNRLKRDEAAIPQPVV